VEDENTHMWTPYLEWGGGSSSPNRGDEEPPPTQRGREVPPPTLGGRKEPPLTQEGREKDGRREEGSQQDRSKQSTRRSHTSWELRMLDPSENPPKKRVRRSTRGTDTIDNSCEVTRENTMICPITCACRNSLLDISGETRVVSHILRATRKILKNELIASFGLTAAITNKDEISELKLVQKERNSDLYRTSIQYTVLGSIHGKEVYLVAPQDVSLLLKDQISSTLRKHLKQNNEMEGLGQLANHTCCDIHWNANLEVAAIEHCEETEIVPMAILRARKDIEKDTGILTRYWHKEKDAWQNKFECDCCACTNHTGTTTNPPVTVNMKVIDDTVLTVDHTPRERQDLEMTGHEPNQDHSASNKQDDPDSEMDDWDWDEMEASPSREQPPQSND